MILKVIGDIETDGVLLKNRSTDSAVIRIERLTLEFGFK